MIKNNKWKVVLSSVIVLLPMLAGILWWDLLPNRMSIHWGPDGVNDGVGTKGFVVFALPLIFLGLHFLCLLVTARDKKQQTQPPKALSIVFWIIPCVSLLGNGVVYAAAFGKTFRFELFVPALFGLMFMVIGNYLPKIKQNRTLGIKISWTLHNEENWNKTHRFGGKVWVVGGLVLLFSVFLPEDAILFVTVFVFLGMMILPVGYSYRLYRQHRKAGIVYVAAARSKTETIMLRIGAVVVPLLLMGIAVVMFTGNVRAQCGDTSLTIQATYWDDVEIPYTDIVSVEYREECDAGTRTNGFGSPRLSLGIFQNDEFGLYTRYAYTGTRACVVLSNGDDVLVVGGKDEVATKALYNSLLKHVGG